MDQLEILKKDWKKQEAALPKLSKAELTKLIYKKSSSIVKWIFIISVLEFILPFIALLFPGYDTSMKGYQSLGLSSFINITYFVYYVVILYFIFRFYKNYKSISANSNPKKLMQNIIKTRKTVKYYIWFNLALAFIISVVVLYITLNSSEFLEKIPEGTNLSIIWIIALFLVFVVIGLFWLFYSLIYGILLNKLKRNYNELVSNGVNEL